MNFFGIGTGEILLILIVALIIWGPSKLPEIARKLGQATRMLRKTSFDLTTAITKEVEKGPETTHKPDKSPAVKPEEPPAGEAQADTPPATDQPDNPEGQQQ